MSPRRVLKRSWWDHNWYKVALTFLFMWTTLGFILGAGEHSARVHENCKSIASVESVVQGIMKRAQSLVDSNSESTPIQRRYANTFYRQAITELQPPNCG